MSLGLRTTSCARAALTSAAGRPKLRLPSLVQQRLSSSHFDVAPTQAKGAANNLEAPPVPPPRPVTAHITLYSDGSLPCDLAHSLLTDAGQPRPGGSGKLATFLSKRVSNPYPLDLKYVKVDGRGPEGEEWERWQAIRREEEEARSLKGAPSALLIHADPSLAPRPPSPADPFSLNPLLPATRTDPIVLPLCVNWTSKQTFQGPRVFSEVESMVRSMKAAQTSRLAAEKVYDPYLRKTGKRVPAREKAHHNRIRWWEVVILLGVLSVEEYEYNLLGLRHWVQDEVDRWR